MITMLTSIEHIDIGEYKNYFKCPETTPFLPVLVSFCTLEISMRSLKLCLTIQKMWPDNNQVSFLGSQKLCLRINCPSTMLISCTANCQA